MRCAPQLMSEIHCQRQQNRGSAEARSVRAFSKRPQWMADTVDQFDHDPDPCQKDHDGPPAPHRPEDAPEAEGEQLHVISTKPRSRLEETKPVRKRAGGKSLPERPEIFLDRVGGLRKD